jgi:hypothetical protein
MGAQIQLQQIIEAIRSKRIRVTDHADEEAASDNLTTDEIYASVFVGEMIEEYPFDRPYPSCLIYGTTSGGVPVHSVWAFNQEKRSAVLITVYKPDPEKWIDWKRRKT